MIRIILFQLRRRAGRGLAMLTAVLLATTGFCVLTGATSAARLEAVGVVQANYRSAYDILVRPAGSRGDFESRQGLLRPNFLSGQFGGLSLDQWHTVRGIDGVEVAAPVAMVGYVSVDLGLQLDLTDHIDRSAQQQLLRLSPETVADRGLTRLATTPVFVYVTRNRLIPAADFDNARQVHVYADGTELSAEYVSARCPAAFVAPLEVLADGRREPICGGLRDDAISPLTHTVRAVELTADGRFRDATGLTQGRAQPAHDRLTVRLPVRVSLLTAAVDPDEEARLSGLDQAVTAGRYLLADEPPTPSQDAQPLPLVPLVAADNLLTDEQVAISVTTLGVPSRARAADAPPDLAALRTDVGASLPTQERELNSIYTDWLRGTLADNGNWVEINDLVTVAAPEYEREGSALRVQTTDPPARLRTPADTERFSSLAVDTALRRVGSDEGRLDQETVVAGVLVGTVDPQAVTRGREDAGAPMETFVPPRLTGADQSSAAALGGQPLLPNSSVTGYLASPPTLLANLAALPALLKGMDGSQSQAPLSAIRVRVAGIDRFDAIARERVRLVAQEIATRTGLDVDIVLGSSGTGQTLILPAGQFGRPQLTLDELWTKKGVAAVIIEAVDRKSAVLLGMVLLVCVLFVGNAVSAAVRDRRREFAILACHGWPAHRLAMLILGEAGIIGLLAGAGAALLTMPVAALVGITVPWSRVALAVGIAVALTLVAALVPALRAGRAYPAAAIQPATAKVRGRARPQQTILRMSLASVRRVPGRSALAAFSLAIAVAALTFAVAVDVVFRGRVVGTVLGDGVSVAVRGIDRITVAGLVVFGVAAVADVLYLGVRERASEFAALQAMGWADTDVARLVSLEGLAIGIAGGGAGATAGLVAIAVFVGGLTPGLIGVAAGSAAAGVLLATAAGVLPALILRRMPASQLAEQ